MIVHLRRIPRYTLVAIVCALLHNAILIGMDALGANVFWCQVASAAVLLPVGFLLQSDVTFRCQRSWTGFLRYSVALITNFPIALLILWLTRNVLGLPMWAAAPISSIALFCWNYATSAWAFSRAPAIKEIAVRG
jgi:putative flippase GtrA